MGKECEDCKQTSSITWLIFYLNMHNVLIVSGLLIGWVLLWDCMHVHWCECAYVSAGRKCICCMCDAVSIMCAQAISNRYWLMNVHRNVCVMCVQIGFNDCMLCISNQLQLHSSAAYKSTLLSLPLGLQTFMHTHSMHTLMHAFQAFPTGRYLFPENLTKEANSQGSEVDRYRHTCTA